MPTVRLRGVVARRPAVPAAVLLIGGICLHSTLPCHPLLWIVLLSLLLTAATIVIRRGMAASCLLAAAILVSGVALGQLDAYYFATNDLGAFAGDEPRLAWVAGTIESAPRIFEADQHGRKLPDKQNLMLRVTAVRTWNGWVSAGGELPTVLSPPRADLCAGQTVRLLGRLERPPPAMNPGGFDAARYDRRRRILLSMHVSRPYDVQIVRAPGVWTSRWDRIRLQARRVLDAGFDRRHSADRALLRALVFADREPALRETQDDFVSSGTTHVLASNGARVAMLAGLTYLLLRLLGVGPAKVVFVVTACVALLGALTMPVSQAVRPAIVCAAVGVGLIGRRPTDAIQLLALAAIAVLVVHPLDLYGAGFQFSFIIVLGLLVFVRPVLRFAAGFEDRDAQVARSLLPHNAWQRRRRWIRRRLIELTAANVVAWVVAIPLAAFHFEQLNPWTVPFGLLLAPMALLALGAGFAKIILTALCPPLAHAWAGACGAPAELLRVCVHQLARAPGADLPFPQPPVWLIFCFYALLILPLLPWPRRQARWFARSAPALGCVAFVILPWCSGFGPSQRSSSPEARITLLSVGAGQCAVLEPAEGGTIVLDAGSSSSADVFRTTIEPFLRHEGCWSVDSVWLSHGDYDHISAVSQLVPDYRARQVVTSPHFRRHAASSRPCAALLAMLDQSRHTPRLVCAGDRMRITPDVRVEVLWPPAKCAMNSNNAGLVLRVVCGRRSILFPADIQEPAERELLKHPELLRSDVLIAPHHGSGEPTTAEFVRAVDPKVILSSNAARLTSKQRSFERETASRPLLRTGAAGAITVTISRNGSVTIAPYVHGQSITIR